ncbi:hypothetical protein [Halorubellus sp. PRR65]|uniref:hypothetical protein n=1 Tax=Halorubellus sp. PRR65 TaxID=3098148 RepID=UPI002B25686B|nr:hypothetical protein [Halorubellus sp. PRR65]
MQLEDRIPDRLDDMAVGSAFGIAIGTLATSSGGSALAERLLFAIASGCLAYAIVWAVRR